MIKKTRLTQHGETALALPILFPGSAWPGSGVDKRPPPTGPGPSCSACWSGLGAPESWPAIREEGLCTGASSRIWALCNLTRARGGVPGRKKAPLCEMLKMDIPENRVYVLLSFRVIRHGECKVFSGFCVALSVEHWQFTLQCEM